MATVTEMRDWLRGQGEDVPVRGKLRADLVDKYEAAHGDVILPDLPDPDLDVWPDDDEMEGIGPADVPIEPEVRPTRRPARQSRQTRSERLLDRFLGGPQKATGGRKGKGKPKPRVGLERFVSRTYKLAGRVLEPLSPAAAACVKVQAPMAGVILEDIVRGTIVDRVLQPVARAEEKLDAVFALTVPPVACMGIEMTWMQEQTPAVVFRRTVLMQMLREGLRTGLEVSEKYAEQIAAAVQRDSTYDARVDELIALIFPPPVMPEAPEPEMAGAAA